MDTWLVKLAESETKTKGDQSMKGLTIDELEAILESEKTAAVAAGAAKIIEKVPGYAAKVIGQGAARGALTGGAAGAAVGAGAGAIGAEKGQRGKGALRGAVAGGLLGGTLHGVGGGLSARKGYRAMEAGGIVPKSLKGLDATHSRLAGRALSREPGALQDLLPHVSWPGTATSAASLPAAAAGGYAAGRTARQPTVQKTASGVEKDADYSPETKSEFERLRPALTPIMRNANAVTDPELLPFEPRQVMAAPVTQDEWIARKREEGARGGAATGAVGGALLGGGGGLAVANRLTRYMPTKLRAPLLAAGTLGGVAAGGVGGYHGGKALGSAGAGRAAAKDTSEDVQAELNADLAERLYDQGHISKKERAAAREQYDQYLIGGAGEKQASAVKTGSLRAYVEKRAGCKASVKKAVLKKTSGGTEFAGGQNFKE
jgi:hypothetical protein